MRMSITGLARRSYNGINKRTARVLVRRMIRPSMPPSDLTFIGSGDGQWPLVRSLMPRRGICYCIGVGTNATFDIGLAAEGHEVHSFDPTPRALTYAKEVGLADKGIVFHPIGIWNEETTLRFFAPGNTKHVNYSVVDLHGTGDWIEAKCERLSTVMARIGHTHIDLFKLDVEGSWGPILDDLLDAKIYPTQICVEFDSPTSTGKIMSMVNRLRSVGYTVAWFSRENFLLVRTAEVVK